MTPTMMSSGASSASGSGGSSSRYAVFDGSTDFSLWRARVENELLRFHLLGYILVRDYDGSQSFEYNGEEIPPKCPLVAVTADSDDEVKEEPVTGFYPAASSAPSGFGRKRTRASPVMQPGRLTRLEVIAERAETMGILQRYLHPEVERAILGKNIFDSWATLCRMYGDRHVSDFYTVHRLLHTMRLGETRGESASDFVARLALLMEQYATIAGIQLTDPLRSMVLAHALPADWAPLLDAWKAFKPYIPYAQLVEKVTVEHNARLVRKEQQDVAAAAIEAKKDKEKDKDKAETTRKESSRVATTKDTHASSATPTSSSSKSSSQYEKAKASAPTSSSSSATKSRPDDSRQHRERRGSDEKAAAASSRDKRSSSRDKRSSSHYASKRDDKKDDRRSDKPHASYDSKRTDDHTSSSSRSYDKKRDDRDDKREYKKEDRRSDKDYYSSSTTTTSGTNYRDKREYTPYNKHMVCYYCLRIGHCFQACWFLRVDMETDSYTDAHKKYSATVTNERSAYMVQRIEQYVKDKKRSSRGSEKAAADDLAPPHTYATDSYAFGYGGRSDSGAARHHNAPLTEAQLPLPPSYAQIASLRSQSLFQVAMPPPPPSSSSSSQQVQQQHTYSYDNTSASASAAAQLEADEERYKKRSRSVFGDESTALGDTSRSHDPRSRSVFRPSDKASGFRGPAASSRRSVSPLPSSAHRAYSSGNAY